MEHYRSLNSYLRERFGKKLYKLALDGGFTCPNRDGTVGTGGCIFCSGGSGSFAESTLGDIEKAINAAKARVSSKTGDAGYIAYFQSFTGTYAPVGSLERLYSEVIAREDIEVLSIGTRPDCLGDEVVALLSRLNTIKPVWVELGLQTIHPQTAEYIRRGYPLPVFDDAVRRLRSAGIEVIVHVILGLPGESREMMLETVDYVGHCGAEGVKLQLLHVLRGTELAREYALGKFETLGMDEYIDLAADCLRLLPPETVIHRLTGDGDKRELIAPLWSADKKRVLNAMHRRFDELGLRQGELFSPNGQIDSFKSL